MTDVDLPPVRLVLDQSALHLYLAGSIHVAEPLQEVALDGVRYGVTAVTVGETLHLVTDSKARVRLREMLELDVCCVLPTPGESWQELGYWRAVTGRADLATTVVAALEHRAPILTRESTRYGDWLPLISIPQ